VTIYDRHDDADAIEPLKALGQDDHPNVANLIGYSYRKLGDYKLSMARSSCCAEAVRTAEAGTLRPAAGRANPILLPPKLSPA
jgi:hypothetical protein